MYTVVSLDPTFLSATELLAELRGKRISSGELLEHYLDRIERHNPDVNAVVTLDTERARAQAAAADDARARGEDLGPLHGLPITIKDALETKDLRTTCGAEFLADHVPAEDATAVKRLRDAGAVIFGKTNTPTMAADGQAYNTLFGTTNNPWDLTRSPGGSSGGSSAALAAGLTSLELGSDIAGSVRIPADYCGVYGLKPSYGVIPLRGHIPGPPGSLVEADMNVLGPLARSADDLELGLDVMAGPDEQRAKAWSLRLPPARQNDLSGYRLAVWLDDEACPVERELVDILRGTVDALADAGAQITERPAPIPLEEAWRTHRALLMGVASAGLTDDDFAGLSGFVASAPPDAEETVALLHARWLVQSKRDWNAVHDARTRARAAWAEFFQEFDAFLCPVVCCAAPPHDQSPDMEARTIEVNGQTRPYWDQVCWIAYAGAAELPAVSAPVGTTAAGLPVGLQIVAPYLEDRTAIDVARRATEVVGGFVAPPGFQAEPLGATA
jgi:amidase